MYHFQESRAGVILRRSYVNRREVLEVYRIGGHRITVNEFPSRIFCEAFMCFIVYVNFSHAAGKLDRS